MNSLILSDNTRNHNLDYRDSRYILNIDRSRSEDRLDSYRENRRAFNIDKSYSDIEISNNLAYRFDIFSR